MKVKSRVPEVFTLPSLDRKIIKVSRKQFSLFDIRGFTQGPFLWAHPDMKTVLEIQLLPIAFLMVSQLIMNFNALNGEKQFQYNSWSEWAFFLPPIFLMNNIFGNLTHRFCNYYTISVHMGLTTMAVYLSMLIMMTDLHDAPEEFQYVEEIGYTSDLFFPWIILIGCEFINVLFCASFAIFSLIDLHGYQVKRAVLQPKSDILVSVDIFPLTIAKKSSVAPTAV